MTLARFQLSSVKASRKDLRTFHIVGEAIGLDDIVDSEGHLANAYDAGDHTLVLVRPDGYIGLISDKGDISEVLSYFAAMELMNRSINESAVDLQHS